MRIRIAMALYVAYMLVVAGAFYRFPDLHLVLWSTLALSSAGAIAAGVLVHRPVHRFAWWLVAVAVTLFAAGDTTFNVLTTILGEEDPFPSLADVFYLAMYPFLAAGLLLFIRYRAGGSDRGSLLDALSLTTSLGLLSWIFLIDPYVRDPELGWLERATSIAYPLGDVLILAMLARLLIVASGNRAAALLGIGTAGLLASDVIYGLIQLASSYQVGSAYDLGWVVFYLAWGMAALHPSMAALTLAARPTTGEMSFRRVALLTAVSLVAPAALLADASTDGVQHGPMIAASSAVLFLLVLLRLSGVVARHRQAVQRERTLRSAGEALVSAADEADLATAISTAVARLAPPDEPHLAVLLDSADELAPASGLPADASWLVQTATLDSSALDSAVADEMRQFPTALLCPLVIADRPTAGPSEGVVMVAASETLLLTLQGALEVLASQAALAVERVTLTREVSRRNSEAYFRTLVQNAHDVILIVDDDGHIRYASPSAESVLGPGSVVGLCFFDLMAPGDQAAAELAISSPSAAMARFGAATCHIRRTDGSQVDVEVSSRDLRDDPTVRGVVLTLRDVTEQRKLQGELTHRAFHDALTGLPNRLLFRDRVGHALIGADRRDGLIGVLLIDLDDFKLVNDTMGHGAGDELLAAVAARLTDVLRPDDTAARLGGDEFAILVEGAREASEVEEIAARVVEAITAPLDGAAGLSTSVSVGVATTSEALTSAEMLRRADLALYAAKEAGKGRWRSYEPGLHVAAMERLEVRTELERALAAGAFQLHYQPIVDLGSGELIGVEALIRWRHPRRGLIPPMEFIRVAEETGLIVPLGAWVLEQALTDVVRWRERAPGMRVSMSVNVSACQVRAPGFVDMLVDALARRDLPADGLVLEITETTLLTGDEQVSADLMELRRLGVRIAIDDFGTGYSSLDNIRLHAVDIVKIDRSFINGVERSRRQTALIGAIVHLARALDLRVVAEGVETAAQREALVLAGCDLGQGYLFSPAVPADGIEPWLTSAAASPFEPVAVSIDAAPAHGHNGDAAGSPHLHGASIDR
jgi:diguanylate cyclase (GGDEF)-like protein/PAS domain S-box-containing protein